MTVFNAPDIQHPTRVMVVGIAFGDGDTPIDNDRTVPVAAAAIELGDRSAGGRVVNVETAIRVVHEQQAAGDDGTGARVVVVPAGMQFPIA